MGAQPVSPSATAVVAATIRGMALYRIRKPRIRSVAIVKSPASGHRWHLLKQEAAVPICREDREFIEQLVKQAPPPDDDYEYVDISDEDILAEHEALVAEHVAAAVAKAEQAAAGRQVIAKAEAEYQHDAALATLSGWGTPQPLAKSADSAVAEMVARLATSPAGASQ
ncbi:MAG: hypothetical protein ACR2KV_09860 [Solirubrobacteraceae bacterium]